MPTMPKALNLKQRKRSKKENSPKHFAKAKCLFKGTFSNFCEIETVLNLGNVECTKILFVLRI